MSYGYADDDLDLEDLEAVDTSPQRQFKGKGKATPQINSGEIVDAPDDEGEDFSIPAHSQGSSIWLVKVPNFLLDRWSSITDENAVIGNLRISTDSKGPDGEPKMALVLPTGVAGPSSRASGDEIPAEYELTMTNKATKNAYVFAEKVSTPQSLVAPNSTDGVRAVRRQHQKRPREPTYIGRVAHECQARPDFESDVYRAIIRKRIEVAEKPKRVVQALNEDMATSNRLASGALRLKQSLMTPSLVKARPKTAADQKLARAPRAEVTDQIMALFSTHEYWSLRNIKERIAQPDAWLKEIMTDVAIMNASGPYAGLYSLAPAFKSLAAAKAVQEAPGGRSAPLPTAGPAHGSLKDEDLSDDEMEAVSYIGHDSGSASKPKYSKSRHDSMILQHLIRPMNLR
ncbi:uncharacterized protein L969DRAFT_100540 [Mixia osmundae IAM 14324]|uniref:Transcription initiation factor IIF subunit beta n=1 Tax=Mixia osmundae (strain CBS 9802 / IAM 14324 / JCM 22182 / KY 12970) TaxID=764103 RepID=G7E3Z9_MIXOS|nr:uncharacterized protein L969DRAFT_100540 [Mixia osmundae IAM 14324]KEI42005.1 hypothetical protein L969DRAFT_100540 [Mixia osmundae IAM 14324]GAA97559.1 hypothetical protein E5Q_04237 [Mixia osmundae IAM 14324]